MKKWIFIMLIASMTILLSACHEEQKNIESNRVDFNLEPSLIAESLKEDLPTKQNQYGFEGDFLSAGNVQVFYPVTDYAKNQEKSIDKGLPIETELQLSRPSDWMLLQTDDKESSLLIEIDQNRLKIMVYKQGAIVPAGCEVDLGDGNFLNYAKIIAYKKNEVLFIHSDYPSSAAYESVYLQYTGNELKLLDNVNGDTMTDSMEEMKDLLNANQTEQALEALSRFEVIYPETYMQNLIDLNKLFFKHLTNQAISNEKLEPQKAIHYYEIALSLVVMTEMNGENDYEAPYLAYDLAMQASESDPEISANLIETKEIALALNRYVQLLRREKLPVSDHLLELSKILNHNVK